MSIIDTYIPATPAELDPAPRPTTKVQQQMHSGLRLANRTYPELQRIGGPANINRFEMLQSFGTSDEIADFLRAEDAKGHRSNLSSCPIAVWASRIVGDCEVNETGISFSFDKLSGSLVNVNVTMTPAMKAFVTRFDNDAYPDLVA